MYYDVDYTLLIDKQEKEKKEQAKPSVERKNTSQEKKYNDFVKQLYSKSKKKIKNISII